VHFGAVNTVVEKALQKRFRIAFHPTILVIFVDKDRLLDVVEQRRVRDEGLVELLPWCHSLLVTRSGITSISRDALYEVALNSEPTETKLLKGPRNDVVSKIDIATAVHISLHPFHVMEDAEDLDPEGIAVLQRWLWVLPKVGAKSSEVALNLITKMSEAGSVHIDDWRKAVQKITVFGRRHHHLAWDSCKGPGRGYACGLWTLLHTAVANSVDTEAPLVIAAARDYVGRCFKCEECSRDFVEICTDFELAAVDQKSTVLWLWRAHNSVNVKTASKYGISHEDAFFSDRNILSDM